MGKIKECVICKKKFEDDEGINEDMNKGACFKSDCILQRMRQVNLGV